MTQFTKGFEHTKIFLAYGSDISAVLKMELWVVLVVATRKL
jgi:hypothetical protein